MLKTSEFSIGQVVSGCTVLGEESSSAGRVMRLSCSCGKEFKKRATSIRYDIKNGNAFGCGCLVGKAGKHLLSNHKLFARYRQMLARCYNENCKSYKHYGGRGIKVCDRWRDTSEGFANFLSDMGDCPVGFSLERRDVNGDYCPSNCCWADIKVQANNKQAGKNNNTGLRGVKYVDNRFEVRHGSKYYGRYKTLLDAAAKRKSLELELQEANKL